MRESAGRIDSQAAFLGVQLMSGMMRLLLFALFARSAAVGSPRQAWEAPKALSMIPPWISIRALALLCGG